MNQTKAIKEHLITGKGLTPLDALNLFGCFRLGARILELKRDGFGIQDIWVKTDSGKRVKMYFSAEYSRRF